MYSILDVLKNFFTHKDFLPPANVWAGTLFTPLQIIFCLIVAVFIVLASVKCSKKSHSFLKKVFIVLWSVMVITEPLINIYDCCLGKEFAVDWGSVLPLWYCSIFMFALPFAVFCKGKIKDAACGHICTLGLVGGLINFIYPASYISSYSCISLAGFRTIFYHGAMIFTAITMILSKYHSFKNVTTWQQLLLPSVFSIILSIPANVVNFTMGTDYMFFRLNSFFFAPLGAVLPEFVSVIIVYVLIIIIQGAPYLPSYINYLKSKKSIKTSQS